MLPSAIVLWAGLVGSLPYYELPISFNQTELGFVGVYIDGAHLQSVHTASIVAVTHDLIVDETLQRLQEVDRLTLTELAQLGVYISYLPDELALLLELGAETVHPSAIEFQRGIGRLGAGTPPANFSFLNNLNAEVRGQTDSDNYQFRGDWLPSINLGGVTGVNMIGALTYQYDSEPGIGDLQRGPFTLFHDRPNIPLRVSAGDVSTSPRGHLGMASVGGISVFTPYMQLQPLRRISPSVYQQILVREVADVEVMVNGRVIQRMRLNPGRYDLADIPLSQGANDIEVYLRYASGEEDIQRFSQFYNAQLLDAGVQDFGLTLGVVSDYTGLGGIEYSDDYLVSAYYERGISPVLTLGANGQFSDYGHIFGVNATAGTPLGALAVRLSVDDSWDAYAASAQWQARVWGSRLGATNLNISYDYYRDFNNRPWYPEAALAGSRFLATYSFHMTDRAYVQTAYVDDYTYGDQRFRQLDLSLNYSWHRLRVSLGAMIGNSIVSRDEEEYKAYLDFTYHLYNPRTNLRYQARYYSLTEQAQLGIGRASSNYVGSTGFDVLHTENPGASQTSGRIDYTANRARMGAFANYSHTADNTSYGGFVNSSFGWAGRDFGWGRGGRGPFTVVKRHASLRGSDVLVNETRFGTEAIATDINALLPARPQHRAQGIEVNVPEAPVGYDWGEGRYAVFAGSVTGNVVEVGSDAFYTVLGTLLAPDGEGIELQPGRLTGEGIEQTFFTNRAGRFIVEGLKPGRYTLILLGEPRYTYELEVAVSDEIFLRIAPLNPN